MKMIETRRSWNAFLGLALLGAAAGGCADDTGAPPAAPTATEAAALFKDPSTSGPRLDVYDFGGHAAISVSGPIGSEGRLAGLDGTDSLDALYRAVHPDATTVPPELSALAARLAPELAALRSLPRPAEHQPVTVDKSQSAFLANACVTFRETNKKYTPKECQWSPGLNQITTLASPPDIYGGDRTYGWNNNNIQANMIWIKGGYAWFATLPAYWWNWMSVASGGPYWGQIYLPNGYTGELGLTHHSLSYTF